MKRVAKILIWIILLAGAVSLVEFFFLQKSEKQPVPPAPKNVSSSTENIAPQPTNTNTILPENNDAKKTDPKPADNPPPEKYLLDIPFYSQAPLSKWDAVHEEMCEESSVLNAGFYLENKKLTKDQFETKLQEFKNLEEKELGVWKSTTVAELKKATDIYFEGKVKSKIIENPTIEQIEAEIVAGHPVIVPLAGRDIGNPNFTPPGPVYHMLVVKGYDTQNFITNDVGTRKGASYPYKKEVVMRNMHDWNEKDIHLGAKKVLVLMK
jgi:hypothetical protein